MDWRQYKNYEISNLDFNDIFLNYSEYFQRLNLHQSDSKPSDYLTRINKEIISKINQQLKLFSQKHNTMYLDYYSSMVGENRGLKKEYTTDGVHLNKKGYDVMSDLVHDVLKKESFAV